MDRLILTQKSSQTGDTLHVAGALAFDPLIYVIVVHAGEVLTIEGLLNFYRQATDPTYPGAAIKPDSAYTNQRVKAIYASTEAAAKALYGVLSPASAADATIKAKFNEILAVGNLFCLMPRIGTAPPPPIAKQIKSFDDFKAEFLTFPDGKFKYMGPLGQATTAIAERFEKAKNADEFMRAENYKALYTILSQKLTARNLKSADIIKGTVQVPTFGQQSLPDATPSQTPIVLLWSRYTGTNTAIAHNPEGDSCVQGQTQINNLLTKLKYNVVTIGHGPRGSEPFKATFDVGEFYTHDPISGDRAIQQSFFLSLMEKYPRRLYQIGQKTGGMDGAALLGIPTIYLEPKGSDAIERMKKWSNGTLPYYRGVVIAHPAPAIVRAMKTYIPDEKGIYTGWKTSTDSFQRARGRLAAMLYAYPKLMGKDEFALGPLGDMPKNVKDKEKWEAQEIKKMNTERFERIANFVKNLKDADLQEDKNDPAKDGEWTKMVQSVNQSMKIPVGDTGTAGYSDVDLGEIEREITKLVGQYSTDKAAVLRTSGAYQTRLEAQL